MTVEHRVASYDFVRAMLLAGYRLVGTTLGHAVLEKGDQVLLVPQRDELPEDLIVALLQKADVQPMHFVALLNRLGSRDTWPEQGELLPAVGEALRRSSSP
jgi:hypothetical protein